MHCDQGLIAGIVYNFQIWNKKEHNFSSSRVISPMYIESPIYLYICWLGRNDRVIKWVPVLWNNRANYFYGVNCQNFWDKDWKFLLLRLFGLLISSLLLYSQYFSRQVFRPSSGIYSCGLNNGFSSRFCVGSRIRHETPEVDRRTYRPKHCEYSNKNYWFGLVWFYGISTILDYLMLNLLYTYKCSAFNKFPDFFV